LKKKYGIKVLFDIENIYNFAYLVVSFYCFEN